MAMEYDTISETYYEVNFARKLLIIDVIIFNVSWIHFFIRRRNKISLSRYFDVCAFEDSANFKICDVIKDITSY